MSKYPEHDKDCFYKFTSMEAASLILENGTFRYSPPSEFNDPFDIQTELYFDFDIGDLPDAVTNEVHRIVTGARKVILNPTSDWGKALGLLIEKHDEGKYRREQLDFLVKPLIGYLSSIFEETRVLYNKHWGNLLNTIKVFCVSENNTSVLMWSHYAEYHTGVCFKLKVLPEKDNPLCVAKEVQYLPFPPSFFNAEEWIDSVVLDKELDSSRLYKNYPLAKSDIWKYEEEWRVWAPFEESEDKYLDMPIVDGEIEAIYFGMNSDPKKVSDLIKLAKEKGINSFYRGSKKLKEYGVEYTEI